MVVGAGAAGLVAAIFAARARRPTVLIESTPDGGRKILISGGGRCNVLPQSLEPERFVTDSPTPLVRRLLRSWPLVHQRAFFERDLRVPLKLEAETRKYFPVSDRARDVRDALVAGATGAGVEVRFNTRLTGLHAGNDGTWHLETSRGPLDASAVIVATGGRSVSSTGSDGAGLDILQSLDHRVHPTYPALTPLVADPAVHAGLSGISLRVRVRGRWRGQEMAATGGFLFTHRGYSGPAVLDVSHLAVRSGETGDRASLRVRWCELDNDAWLSVLQSHSGFVLSAVSRRVPARLAERLLAESGVPLDRRAEELRRHERIALLERLTSYDLPWTGDEGYRKAEVTGGGVSLDEVDPRTLESRRHPRLFLCGELLDAFGPIGGHNFAWAWATGRMAGLGATRN